MAAARVSKGTAGFPLRVGAVDIGSNGIRYSVVEFSRAESFRVILEGRVPIRLGHTVFSSGRISPTASATAVDSLAKIIGQIQGLSVRTFRAVATSAVRESPNRREFLQRIADRTGVMVEVISGSEEIRLVHAAVRRRLPLRTGRWILVELGGGSVEIGLVDSSKVLWSETHAMGAVRLLELFGQDADTPADMSRLVSEYVATIRLSHTMDGTPIRGFIATGGNMESLAKIGKARTDSAGRRRLHAVDLRHILALLSRMSVRERMRKFNLRPDRADVILPAGIVYHHLAELVGAREIWIPSGGIREGIVYDLRDALTLRPELQDKRTVDDAVSLGRKFNFDETHAVHVAALAGSLFDQLEDLHRLDRRDRHLLLAAAVLHDIGGFLSYKGHHKHSFYLISNSELPGFTPKDMAVIGTIARYHRKGPPTARDEDFARLGPANRDRVRLLSALLRIADALDKEHRGNIRRVRVRAGGGNIRLSAAGTGDLLLEHWALKKKSRLFQDVFGLDVTLEKA